MAEDDLTIEQLAALLGVCRRTVERAIEVGGARSCFTYRERSGSVQR